MRHTVLVDEMVNYLKRWCTRETDGGEAEGADFTTTVKHIHSIYRYLQAECSNTQLKELFQHSPAVFIEYDRSESKNYAIKTHTLFLRRNIANYIRCNGQEYKLVSKANVLPVLLYMSSGRTSGLQDASTISRTCAGKIQQACSSDTRS